MSSHAHQKKIICILLGAFFGLSCFVFLDGAIVARAEQTPYNFTMWLPQLLGYCGIFVMTFVDPSLITKPIDEDEGDQDEITAKSLFFVASVLSLSSLFVSMYKLNDSYNTSRYQNSWPGVALIFQSVFLILCAILVFTFRNISKDDDDDDL